MKDKQLSVLILGGLVAGFLLGLGVRALPIEPQALLPYSRFIGELFLRALFMLILPLIVPMILLGIQKLSADKALQAVGWRATLAILGLTLTAALVGLAVILLIKPGNAIAPEARSQLLSDVSPTVSPSKATPDKIFLALLPKNPLHEMVMAFTPHQEGGFIAVVSFLILLGIALSRLSPTLTQPLYQILEALFLASQWLLGKVLWLLAPIGIAALIFSATLSLGLHILPLLGAYVGSVLLGLALQMFGVYSLFLYIFAKRSPWETLRGAWPALLLAFSSASSNATLPVTLRTAIDKLKIAPPIAQFITTLGATVNQNGTALYEGVTLIFLLQAFGEPLSASKIFLVILFAILIAIGAAGVPGGSLPLLAGVLPALGVPSAAIGLVYGIDRILDMSRTVLNVYGDLVIGCYLHTAYASTDEQRNPT